MHLRPCPICQTEMTIRSVGSENDVVSSYFIYCRQCGYGPVETFKSVDFAAKHWDEHVLKHDANSAQDNCQS